jgi:large subunit ribosomal protein L29
VRGIHRLREKADIELREELEALRKECFTRRYRSGTDETEERGKVRKLRLEIARIQTILREREMGLRREAKPVPKKAGPAARGGGEGGKE